DGRAWRYSSEGWEAVFKPVGKCTNGNSGISDSVHWSGLDQKDRVVKLPIVDGLVSRPEHLPLSFPKQISETLLKHHSNPPVYFISQFIWYLMRNTDHMTEILAKAESKIPFGKGLQSSEYWEQEQPETEGDSRSSIALVSTAAVTSSDSPLSLTLTLEYLAVGSWVRHVIAALADVVC
ncbi:hypothetical protein FO519_010310, partial [Halicephalobus sp. NKZ332]